MRATALMIIALLALIALAASEHAKPNAGAPLVKAAVPTFPEQRIWKLYTTCPVDQRNFPVQLPAIAERDT